MRNNVIMWQQPYNLFCDNHIIYVVTVTSVDYDAVATGGPM